MKLYLMKNRTNLRDNGYNVEEEGTIYDMLLEAIYNNPRYYLDNLNKMTTSSLSWHNYNTNATSIPLKYVKKSKAL